MGQQEWVTKDFYRTLGVAPTADNAEIKKAYRRLARTYHPDHNSDNPAAEERFKEIGEAYAVLSDDKKRREYDTIRRFGGGGSFGSGPAGGAANSGHFADGFASMFGGATGHGAGGFANSSFQFNSGNAGGGDLNDLLSGLFGGAARTNGFSATNSGARGADVHSNAELSFRQAVSGATLKLRVDGKDLTVRTPAGVRNGQQLRLRGKGRAGAGGPAGDLLLNIKVADHPVYSRSGDKDLIADIPISVGEAVGGGSIEVPLLDGSTARIKVPAGTSSGTKLRLKGRGLKTAKSRRSGDLFVRVHIVVPKRPTREATEAAATIDAANPVDVRADLTAKPGW